MTVTYSKYRMIPAELQGHDTSDEDEDEYFTQDDARIELPTKLRESFNSIREDKQAIKLALAYLRIY